MARQITKPTTYFRISTYMMFDLYTSSDGVIWDLITETQTSLFHGIQQVSSGASTGLGDLYQPDDYSDKLNISRALQYIKFDVYGGPQKTNNVLSSISPQMKGVDDEQKKETVQFGIQS